MKEMIGFLRDLRGNPKTLLVMDPLWTGPFNMYMPFVTIYMFSLGLGDVEIGLLLTVGMVAQFVMALLGGVVTDKFGRRRTLLFADLLAWNIPVLIWAFARDFWWFLVAALINSVFHIGIVAFECTWLDDTEEEKRPKIINWFHMGWLGTVFFALISGYLVERFTVIPAMRGLYLFAFVIMGIRMVILFFHIKETKVGRERMEATRDQSIVMLLSGYKDVFFQIIRSRGMRRVLILLPMVSVFQMITGTFFALYVTQDLEISEVFLVYFPVARAGVSLLFFFFIQNRLGAFKARHLMCAGIVLYIVGHGLLLAAPPQNYIWLGAYALADAWAGALFLPRLDNLVFSAIDQTERARCRALINVIVLAITSPFGVLAGFLSDMDRRLPFALNILLFVVMIYFALSRQKKKPVQA